MSELVAITAISMIAVAWVATMWGIGFLVMDP